MRTDDIARIEPLKTVGLKQERPFNWGRFLSRFLTTIFVTIIVGFLLFILKDSYQEIFFAAEHPEFVRELREAYLEEHREADQNTFLRLRMELPRETVPTQIQIQKPSGK